MGIDACIYLKTSNGDGPKLCHTLPIECGFYSAVRLGPLGATHQICQPWRYYGPGYERGPWPSIASVLMTLYVSPDVETVWYFGDCDNYDVVKPFTPELLHKFNAHYMAEGNRPYYGKK